MTVNAEEAEGKKRLVEFFDVVITRVMSGKAKPSPKPFLLEMKKICVTAKETMSVGF